MALGTLRLLGLLLMVDVISLAFGVAFLLIAHGLAMGMIRLAVYWQPTQRLLRRVALGTSTTRTTAPLTTIISTVHLFISIALTASVIAIGVWLLFVLGFWGQNLIWIATH